MPVPGVLTAVIGNTEMQVHTCPAPAPKHCVGAAVVAKTRIALTEQESGMLGFTVVNSIGAIDTGMVRSNIVKITINKLSDKIFNYCRHDKHIFVYF